MKKFLNNKFSLLSLSIITILVLSLIFISIKERNIKLYNEKIYITALEKNLVHINDSLVYLEQIINDYNNLTDYELKLNSIAENINSMGDILPVVFYNDKSKNLFSNNGDKSFNTFIVLFMKYSQIVKDWSINIDEEKSYGYPSLEDLKGLQSDLTQYYDLFVIKQEGNKFQIGSVKLIDFDYSYLSKNLNEIIKISYFEDIRNLY